MYVDRRRIDFEILGMKGFEVKFGVLEKSFKVLEKFLKLFLKKGTNPVNSMTC